MPRVSCWIESASPEVQTIYKTVPSILKQMEQFWPTVTVSVDHLQLNLIVMSVHIYTFDNFTDQKQHWPKSDTNTSSRIDGQLVQCFQTRHICPPGKCSAFFVSHVVLHKQGRICTSPPTYIPGSSALLYASLSVPSLLGLLHLHDLVIKFILYGQM